MLQTNLLKEWKVTYLQSDISLIVTKIQDPLVVRNLGEEIKKLGLSDDKEVDLMIKFSQNPKYEKYFCELNSV